MSHSLFRISEKTWLHSYPVDLDRKPSLGDYVLVYNPHDGGVKIDTIVGIEGYCGWIYYRLLVGVYGWNWRRPTRIIHENWIRLLPIHNDFSTSI